MTGKPTPCQALRAKLERVEHELRAAKRRIEEQDKQLVANANSYDGLLAHLHEAEAKLDEAQNDLTPRLEAALEQVAKLCYIANERDAANALLDEWLTTPAAAYTPKLLRDRVHTHLSLKLP